MQHERDMGTAVGADRRVADRGADMLARYEKAYLSGYLPALAEALNICHFWRLPPPRWLVDAVTTTTTERMTKIEKKRHCENMKHYTRWLEVTYLRLRRHELGGMTWNVVLHRGFGVSEEYRMGGTWRHDQCRYGQGQLRVCAGRNQSRTHRAICAWAWIE